MVAVGVEADRALVGVGGIAIDPEVPDEPVVQPRVQLIDEVLAIKAKEMSEVNEVKKVKQVKAPKEVKKAKKIKK